MLAYEENILENLERVISVHQHVKISTKCHGYSIPNSKCTHSCPLENSGICSTAKSICARSAHAMEIPRHLFIFCPETKILITFGSCRVWIIITVLSGVSYLLENLLCTVSLFSFFFILHACRIGGTQNQFVFSEMRIDKRLILIILTVYLNVFGM